MSAPGRNDPCPCGSGRKYKHCCLAREREARGAEAERSGAAEIALDFLFERFPEAVGAAIDDDFLGTLDEEQFAALDELADDLREMVTIAGGEWLLADARLVFAGREVPAVELVLGPRGPALGETARRWLTALAAHRLGLYEVTAVEPGVGMHLRSALDRRAQPVFVDERSGSRSFVRWDVLGARIVPWQGRFQLSGAIYPLPREAVEKVRRLRRRVLRPVSEGPEFAHGRAIGALWLAGLVAPPLLPELRDAGTGEPVLLVTDHYDVLDWQRVEERLQREDVAGDRRSGWAWLEPGPADGPRRTRLALNPRRGDRLEAFARSRRAADQGRSWIDATLGDAVRFRVREQSDPWAAVAARREHPGPTTPQLPAAPTAEILRRYYEHHYGDVADRPLPVLGGKTPRQAARTAVGRRKVLDLVKGYENHEARLARQEGREAIRFGRLRQELGLPPED